MYTYRIFLNLVNENGDGPSEDRIIYGDDYDSVEALLKSYDWVGELIDEDWMLEYLKAELESEDYEMPVCIFMQDTEWGGHSIYYGVEVEGAKQLSIPGVWYLAIARDEY